MDREQKPIGLDGEGYEVLTKAVLAMMMEYSELIGQDILFEELGDSWGIAFSSDSGALVMTERRTVTGRVIQSCQYPFLVVYRTASTQERQKLQVQTFLDTLGKWLCGENATVGGKTERRDGFPTLAGEREITRITRMNAYGTQPQANGVQDWVLPVTVQYTNIIEPVRAKGV